MRRSFCSEPSSKIAGAWSELESEFVVRTNVDDDGEKAGGRGSDAEAPTQAVTATAAGSEDAADEAWSDGG